METLGLKIGSMAWPKLRFRPLSLRICIVSICEREHTGDKCRFAFNFATRDRTGAPVGIFLSPVHKTRQDNQGYIANIYSKEYEPGNSHDRMISRASRLDSWDPFVIKDRARWDRACHTRHSRGFASFPNFFAFVNSCIFTMFSHP